VSVNFDDMPWLVTSGDVTFGPFDKARAIEHREKLRSEGRSAEAWAAQVPDPRKLTRVP